MNCQRAQASFIDCQSGALSPAESAAVREHLKTCLVCQREWAGLQETLLKLDRLPNEAPSPRLRTEFYAMLETHRRDVGTVSPFARIQNRVDAFFAALLPARPALQFALALVLLVGGLFVGQRLTRPAAPDPATARELADLRRKVDSMGEVVAYSLAQQQPANDRLRAVLAPLARGAVDEHTVTDLMNALAFDPSTNVRLSALETLYAHADQAPVRAGVLAALSRESSPLVQLAMIDFLTSIRDREAAPAFESLTRNANTNKAVRDAAQRALVQL